MEWIGLGVAALGLAITAAGVVGANVVFFRFMPKLLSRRAAVSSRRREGRGVPRTDQLVAHEFVFGLLLFAALAASGLTILLVGLVVGGNVVNWAPLMPLALAALSIGMAAHSGWRLRQLRNV